MIKIKYILLKMGVSIVVSGKTFLHFVLENERHKSNIKVVTRF